MSKKKLKNNSLKKGVIWTIFNRTFVIGMQFLAMIVLARFLSPDDFAIMGIAMFFIAISQVLLDSGMGGSLLKKKNIEDRDYSTLFIFNMAVGIIMYLLLLICARPLAKFYNIADLASIINVIGISIVISAFGKIQNILLLKELRFREISVISIISSFIALVTAVIMAIYGFGVWALVMQNIVSTTLIVFLQFAYNRYFPPLKFSVESFKEQWQFGSHLLYSQLLNSAYQNIFSMIFPKISTLNFSGLYAQANKVQQVPYNVINSVVSTTAFPVLAAIDNPEEFKKQNRDFTRKTYLLSFSVFIALSIFAKQTIAVLLGPQWVSATPILAILSFGGIGTIVFFMVRNAIKSIGTTKKIFRIEIYKSLIGIGLLLLTFSFGDYFILGGIVFTLFISALLAMRTLAAMSNMTMREQIQDIVTSLLPMVPAAIAAILFVYFVDLGDFITLICGMVIYYILIVISGIIMKNSDVIQLTYPLIKKFKSLFR